MQNEIQFPRYRSSSLRLQDGSRRVQIVDCPFSCPCSIPAVLCSNNWQSAVGSEASQPSSGHPAAKEPSRLNPVSAVNGHPLPEFDQDSWTVNAPPATDKRQENPQPLDLPNNNNNNNKALRRAAESVSPLRTADPAGAGTLAATSSLPSELSGTSDEAAATDSMPVVALTSDGADDVQESSSSSGDVVP